jgi:secondary thiamine-phosphate synthase enzyme
MIKTEIIHIPTNGNCDIVDLTSDIENIILQSGIIDGLVTIFTPSSTSGITTIEYESGCLADLQRLFEQIVPVNQHYAHNARWGDGNGHSHVRAALLGASFSVPVIKQRMTLGTWQQVILVDFDNRPRQREIVVQIMSD